MIGPLTVRLGPAYEGQPIGYRILNLDRTLYAAFTTVDFDETIPGTFSDTGGGVEFPDAGGYIIVGPAGTDVLEIPFDPSAGGSGSIGGIEYTYTVTNSVTADPVPGVQVWFATDNAGSNVVWYGLTDVFGVARDGSGDLPALDAGTYYIWRRKAGFDFTNPDTEVVS